MNFIMTNNTALQVINFNFYGDELIALKDNATGEIYTSINSFLRGIGFTDKDQIRKRRDKWINDVVISKGVVKFNIPTQEVVAKNDTTLFDEKETYCIYQDKCADVLASVFIENKTIDQITMQPILDTLNTFTKTVNDTLLSLNERMSKLEESQEQVKKSLSKKRFSYWNSKMFPKYQLLMDYFEIPTGKNGLLYKELYKEFHNTYSDIEINQVVDDYCYDNGLDSCFTLDAIEYDKTVRKLFESLVDGLLEKYDLISENVTVKEKTIFDN